MKRTLLWSGILVFAALCFAQKNELDMVLGNTRSFSSNTTFSTHFLAHSPVTTRLQALILTVNLM